MPKQSGTTQIFAVSEFVSMYVVCFYSGVVFADSRKDGQKKPLTIYKLYMIKLLFQEQHRIWRHFS